MSHTPWLTEISSGFSDRYVDSATHFRIKGPGPPCEALYMDETNQTLGGANQTSQLEPLNVAVYKRFMANIDLSPPDPPVKFRIPQRPYCQGTALTPGAVLQNIFFAMTHGFDFPAELALSGRCDLLVDGDSAVFTEQVQTINLRIEWPGYEGWGAQIRTVNYQERPRSITRAKLLTEVAKQLDRFIESKRLVDIEPAYARYKVGPEGIELRHIHIASLEQVSRGSWQPRFVYNGQ